MAKICSIIKIGNESHRNVCYLIYKYTPHCLAEQNVVYFYCSLFDSIMYIILNKVTFIVKEIINPIIRNNKKSTINTTPNLSIKHRGIKGNTHICLFSFPMIITIYYYVEFCKYKMYFFKINS